jgi:hypothetical protein
MQFEGRFVVSAASREHPALSVRKEIFARAWIARNLRLRAAKKKILRTKHLDTLIDSVIASAQAPAIIQDDVTFDQYLATFVRYVAEFVDRQGAVLDKDVRDLFQQFAEGLSVNQCEDCAGRAKQRPCNGKLADWSVMSRGMDCWRFLTELFQSLVDFASEIYSPLLPADSSLQLRIGLQTTTSSDEKLTAETRYAKDSSSERAAQVILYLPEAIVQEHLEHLPYVIFHEVFVHVAESFLDAGVRSPTPETCPFREGYMDSVAAMLLARVLKEEPHRIPAFFREFTREMSLAVEIAHHMRLSPAGPSAEASTQEARRISNVVKARRDGRMAFEEVVEAVGIGHARNIGVAANVMELDEDARIALVERLMAANASSGSHRTWLNNFISCSVKSDSTAMLQRIKLVSELQELAKTDF